MESLRDKMYNYEVNPSPNSWEKISAELDNAEMGHEFPAALYNMEVTPPAATWEKVNAAINPESETIVRPIFRKQSPFLRYAAAAIVVGLIGFAILRLVISAGNNSENASSVAENKDSIKSSDTISGNAKEDDTSNSVTNESSLTQQDGNVLAVNPSLEKTGKRINQRTITNKSRGAQYPETDLSQSIYAYEDHVPDIADRYVMLMTPDGNFIRMAKKWSELLCCISGEEQDPDCKDQLKKWQQKIATSTLASSPSNFMDILGLVNSLQENNGL